MKSIIALCMCFGLLSLMGCETDHHYDQYIYNQSSQEVTFRFFGAAAANYGDSLVVPAGEQVQLYQFYKLGAQPEGIDCAVPYDTLTVEVANGKTLTKDIFSEDAWETEISGKRTVMQSCTFRIVESDLQ